MSVPKRMPSSSVKKPTSISRNVSMPASLRLRITSMPPSTPRGAVEGPAGSHGVDVRAHQHTRQRPVAPGPHRVDVADPVDADLETGLDHPLHAAAAALASESVKASWRTPRRPVASSSWAPISLSSITVPQRRSRSIRTVLLVVSVVPVVLFMWGPFGAEEYDGGVGGSLSAARRSGRSGRRVRRPGWRRRWARRHAERPRSATARCASSSLTVRAASQPSRSTGHAELETMRQLRPAITVEPVGTATGPLAIRLVSTHAAVSGSTDSTLG